MEPAQVISIAPVAPMRVRGRFTLADMFIAVFMCASVLAALHPQIKYMDEDNRNVAFGSALVILLLGSTLIVVSTGSARRSVRLAILAGLALGVYIMGAAFSGSQSIERNEWQAYRSCQQLMEAQRWYASSLKPPRYATSLKELADAKLIPEKMAAAEGEPGRAKAFYGYLFKLVKFSEPTGTSPRVLWNGLPADEVGILAFPTVYNKTGRNSYSTSVADVGRCVSTYQWGDETYKRVQEFP